MVDVDAVTIKLYGLRPEEFTAARDDQAAQARRAGEPAAAKHIAGLRKPTLAAWAANLLARADEDQAQRLLALGQALREAHRALAGQDLRELSHQQHVVIAAMAREARRLAGEAGHAVSEDVQREVEGILHSVLADPPTAEVWVRGVLVKAPTEAVGFTGLEPPPSKAPPPKRPAATANTQRRSPSSALLAEEREAKELARAEADRTAREAEQAEDALARAEADLVQTRTGIGALDEQIAALHTQLDRVGRERTRMSAAEEAAVRRHHQADEELTKARSAAREAKRALKALDGGR
ncbi:hypothetical protein ACTVZO_41335 [Streptomyces sp. IBSNAI002]|uniref:hypothetical protein n=1 Tax=Streptomyces sp. IBSNAI002 TaxID=3457500 RepID=UPI003FD12001